MRVVAVVVAFNNNIELKQCLDSLFQQDDCLESIIVIDNSSQEYILKNRSIIDKFLDDKINIEYIINESPNKGSAKGFSTGMQIAYGRGYDYIWLNDQDGCPDENCLKELISVINNFNDKESIYAPMVCDINNGFELENFRSDVNKMLHGKKIKNSNDLVVEIMRAGTTGILIPKEVVSRNGVYNCDEFFVGLEDFEYCARVVANGGKIYMVKNAIYKHPNVILKRNVKKSFIKELLYKLGAENIVPFNLFITYKSKNGNSIRNDYLCIGAAYINKRYVSVPYRYYNFIISIIRLMFKCVTYRDVDFYKTLSLYRQGVRMAKVKNNE